MMRYFLALLAAAGLSSCATVQRPATTSAQLEADGDTARGVYEARIDTIVEGLARRSIIRGDHALDILLLSGGGQHGAYGIGFLRGWRSRTDAPMPRFDLVTGISTGGLQAPFALLGTEAALDQASTLYRSATSDFAPTFDKLFWLRRTGGVVNTKRYQGMIEREMDTRMADQLQTSFAEGRQLVIGTTDFDLGIGQIWDIGHELTATSDGLDRVQKILLATSAIPGIFPPVMIDGHVHADGGIVSNALAVLDFEGYRKLAARLAALGVEQPVTVRIWVLVNMWTHSRSVAVDPSSRSAISQRSNVLMFWNHQLQYLAGLKDMTRAVNAEVPGLRLEMRYTAIPSEFSSEPGAADLFNGEWMTRIEQFGFERAQSDKPWDVITTPYARPLPVLTPTEKMQFDESVAK